MGLPWSELIIYIQSNTMNKIFVTAAITAMVLVQKGFAQESNPLSQHPLLTAYFSLKDELAAGIPTASAEIAGSFAGILAVAEKTETANEALLKDARAISGSGDLEFQRDKFASLSLHMLALAKTSRLSPHDVFHQYCPMKKASWLSNSKAIKNPYYGRAMLSCGNVKEIL